MGGRIVVALSVSSTAIHKDQTECTILSRASFLLPSDTWSSVRGEGFLPGKEIVLDGCPACDHLSIASTI